MSRIVCLVFLAVTCLAGYEAACPCTPMSLHEKFCVADFAILVQINDNGTVENGQMRYNVDVLNFFRTKLSGTVDLSSVWTTNSPCGITMRENKYYIVTGYQSKAPGVISKMTTSVCYLRAMYRENPLETFVPPVCPKDAKTDGVILDQETIMT